MAEFDTKVWYDAVLQQMAAESYLDGIGNCEAAGVRVDLFLKH